MRPLKSPLPPLDRVREVLHYDPGTGIFIRLIGRRYIGEEAGGKTKYGYIHIAIDGRYISAHRLAWFYMTGTWPKNPVSHLNRDGTDNRWQNLIEASRPQIAEFSKDSSANATGFKGVTKDIRNGKERYRAFIRYENKRCYLGSFVSPEEAHAAYCLAASERRNEVNRSRQ
jgi:hypothetical protein